MNENERINRFLYFMDGRVNDEMLDWLITKGFFTAPASTKYPTVLYTHTADMIASRIIGI